MLDDTTHASEHDLSSTMGRMGHQGCNLFVWLSKGCPKMLIGNSHVCGNAVYVQGNTYASFYPPRTPFWEGERTYVHSRPRQPNAFCTQGTCREDSHYTQREVSMQKCIMFTIGNLLSSGKEPNTSLSLAQVSYKLRGYYQYRAIPIYRKVLQHLREICRTNAL